MSVNKIIDLCYKICNAEDKDNWMHIEDFILHSVNDNEEFIQIEALNRSNTALFKIRAKKRDLGLIFNYPMVYDKINASLRKWKLRRLDLTNYSDSRYVNLLKFDDVFDIDYDSFDYSDLSKLLNNFECNQIEIRNNGCYNVYSKYLIESMLIDDDFESIGLKLIHQDAPLRLNYQYGIFDVYCLVAPKLEVEENIFYLRV